MRIDELIFEAELALDLDDVNLAEQKINHVLVLDSQNFQAKKILALCYLQSRREKEAEEILDELLQLDDQAFDLIFFKAVRLNDDGKLDEALRLCEIVINNCPDFPLAYSVRGLINYNLKKPTEAYTDLNYAIKKDKRNPLVYHQRGIVNLCNEKNKEALKDFEKSLKLDKNFIEAKIYKASALRMLGRKDKALNTLENIELDEHDVEEIVEAAIIYHKNEQLDRSLDLLNKALQIDSTSVSAHYTRFIVNTKKLKFEEAKTDLDNALNHDDSYFGSYIMNGYAYLNYKKGEFEESINGAKSALIDYPDFFWLNLTLAEVYGTINDYSNFYRNLEIAIKGGIGLEDIDEAIRNKYITDHKFKLLTKKLRKTGPYG